MEAGVEAILASERIYGQQNLKRDPRESAYSLSSFQFLYLVFELATLVAVLDPLGKC
jgi:hypothetical protein